MDPLHSALWLAQRCYHNRLFVKASFKVSWNEITTNCNLFFILFEILQDPAKSCTIETGCDQYIYIYWTTRDVPTHCFIRPIHLSWRSKMCVGWYPFSTNRDSSWWRSCIVKSKWELVRFSFSQSIYSE